MTQASNAADFEHYQARIRSLEEEITAMKHQAAPAAEETSGAMVSSEELDQLRAQLSKTTAEVLFLKDTVRLECEERIQLVTQLASLTKSGPAISASSPNLKALSRGSPLPPKAPSASPANPQPGSENLPSSPASQQRAFEERMLAATAKKERKLARSSSLKKLQKYSTGGS